MRNQILHSIARLRTTHQLCEGLLPQLRVPYIAYDTALPGGDLSARFAPSRGLATAEESINADATASEVSPLLSPPVPSGNVGDANPSYAQPVYGKTPSVYGIGKAGARQRNISMSEKKLNYFAKLIRRMHVDDALAQCKLQPKKAGKICAQVIQSAMANAEHNHGLDRSSLMVDIINLGRGKKRYKMWECARGRAAKRNNALSHMEVILKETDARPRMKFVKPLLERLRSREKLELQEKAASKSKSIMKESFSRDSRATLVKAKPLRPSAP